MLTLRKTKSARREARRKQLQEMTVTNLRRLDPYKANKASGIKGDATSENPSKVEMIETILDFEIGKLRYPL